MDDALEKAIALLHILANRMRKGSGPRAEPLKVGSQSGESAGAEIALPEQN